MVSALLLASQLDGPVSAQPTTEQLSTMVGFLENNDVQGLRAFVEASPELLEGDSPLAILLRRFMAESEDLTAYLSIEPDLRNALGSPADTEDEGSSTY